MSEDKNDDATKPEGVSAGGWTEANARPKSREFPGPRRAGEPLRIAMRKGPYADITAHARESLDQEVCGVLVGHLCEDDEGPFVEVEGTIRGASARKGSTHVTFTQETWNQIHKEKEEKHAKRQIVGWYHTHPGFGVEFSEMDLFIQRNFFPGGGQIAYVIDPLGGREAIVVNAAGGTKPVSKFWVDGRERRCAASEPEPAASGEGASAGAIERALKDMESRLSQAMAAMDAQAASNARFITFVGLLVAAGVIVWIGSVLASHIWADLPKPPDLVQYVPVPVMVNGKPVMLGVGVAKWEIPEELNAAIVQVEREKQAALEEARKKAAESGKGPANAPSAAPATRPAGGNP